MIMKYIVIVELLDTRSLVHKIPESSWLNYLTYKWCCLIEIKKCDSFETLLMNEKIYVYVYKEMVYKEYIFIKIGVIIKIHSLILHHMQLNLIVILN